MNMKIALKYEFPKLHAIWGVKGLSSLRLDIIISFSLSLDSSKVNNSR